MFKNFTLWVIVTACTSFSVTYGVLPDFLKICYRNDLQVGKCIVNSIMHLLPYLRSGIPEYDIPSIEPLQVGNVMLNTGTDSARVYANLTNIKVWNASTFVLQELIPNVPKNSYQFKVKVPHLRLEGNYMVDTKILFLHIKGNGPFHINVTDYYFDCVLKGNQLKSNNVDHLVFEKMKCQIAFGKASIRLEHLFQANEVLSKATNDVINDNLQIFYEAIKPNLVDALTSTFTDIANKITNKFDYNEVFPIK